MMEWIISSSVIMIIVIAMRAVLQGRISPKLQYALWAVVLVRLLIPVSLFQSNYSVMNILSQDTITRVEVQMDTPILNDHPQTPRPNFQIPQQNALVQGGNVQNPQTNIPNAPQNPITNGNPAVNENQSAKPDVTPNFNSQNAEETVISQITTSLSWKHIMTLVWATGTVIMASVLLWANLSLDKRLKQNRRRTRVTRKLPSYVTDQVATPCLFGLKRPVIYLTAETEDEETMAHVLAHELTHYKHKDHIWSALRCICLCLHWYNPLAWICASLSKKDAELACDESTIRSLGEDQRVSYGETLIRMTCAKRESRDLLLTATTMSLGKRTLKDRIRMIAKNPKTAVYTMIAVILILTLAVGCTFSGTANNPTTEPTEVPDATVPGSSVSLDATLPVPETPLTQMSQKELVDYFQNLLSYSPEQPWYNAAVSHLFEYDNSKDFHFDLSVVLSGGFTEPCELTENEKEFLRSQSWTDEDFNKTVYRVSEDDLRAFLNKQFGISNEMYYSCVKGFTYWDETQNCYICCDDFTPVQITVDSVDYFSGDTQYYTYSVYYSLNTGDKYVIYIDIDQDSLTVYWAINCAVSPSGEPCNEFRTEDGYRILVEYVYDDYIDEHLILYCVDFAGNVIWTHESDTVASTDWGGVAPIGIAGERFFFREAGIVALDIKTGKKLFKSDFVYRTDGYTTDGQGNLYISADGTHGNGIHVVDSSGNTIYFTDELTKCDYLEYIDGILYGYDEDHKLIGSISTDLSIDISVFELSMSEEDFLKKAEEIGLELELGLAQNNDQIYYSLDQSIGFTFYKKSRTLYEIRVTRIGISTNEGLRVGDRFERMIEIYGNPDYTYADGYTYYFDGYDLNVMCKDGRVLWWCLDNLLPFADSIVAQFTLGMSEEDFLKKAKDIGLELEDKKYVEANCQEEYTTSYEELNIEFYEGKLIEIWTNKARVPTAEGLYVGDSIDRMIEIYGTDYKKDVEDYSVYQYQIDDCYLNIFYEDGVITSWSFAVYPNINND